ncbi:MAG: response regulator transcription factor [Alphaproteobacteria bacterium]|jgi:two-component system nitrate/nitrite response regulator NarL|nr:response regulator transcription factor [Alphaproteobacteria bacterium]
MRLLIADDHSLFREAMALYVERTSPEAEVILAKDLGEAIECVERGNKAPDLVLLDLNMPGMNGLKGFAEFRKKFPDLPAALLSGVAEPEDVQEAMDLGAVGFFPKTLSGRALLKAIELVMLGEKYIPVDTVTGGLMPSYYSWSNSPQPVKKLPIRTVGPATSSPPSGVSLTPREQEILSELCLGKTNKDIARDLDLQPVTVKLHVRGVCKKLGVTNRTQAVIKAFELGVGKAVH